LIKREKNGEKLKFRKQQPLNHRLGIPIGFVGTEQPINADKEDSIPMDSRGRNLA